MHIQETKMPTPSGAGFVLRAAGLSVGAGAGKPLYVSRKNRNNEDAARLPYECPPVRLKK